MLEYFNSTHGARKGLADTALKTANSGYLTRRLVDVAQDSVITEDDCGTTQGLTMTPWSKAATCSCRCGQRVLGRYVAEDIMVPGNDEDPMFPATPAAGRSGCRSLDAAGVQSLKVRSTLTCESDFGICAQCYGRDLARGTNVNIGEAVGVIAAQSIGEPGTQLTMRTFHIGGTARGGGNLVLRVKTNAGKTKIVGPTVTAAHGNLVAMSRNVGRTVGARRPRTATSATSSRTAPPSARQGRRPDRRRPTSGGVGPLHHPDPDGSRRS